MVCTVCDCDAKMRCCYSVPTGAKLQFRTYKCPQCGARVDTIELPVGLFDNLDMGESIESMWRAVIIRVRKEKSKGIMFARLRARTQKGAATGEAAAK